MKYMLLIYHDEQSWSAITEAERRQIYMDYRKLREELLARGQFVLIRISGARSKRFVSHASLMKFRPSIASRIDSQRSRR